LKTTIITNTCHYITIIIEFVMMLQDGIGYCR